MPESAPRALTLSHYVVRLLIALNLMMGVVVLGLLVAGLIDAHWVLGALGIPAGENGPRLVNVMRAIQAIGLAGVAMTHFALSRLRAIVATVADGDPFVAENATRLQQLAWATAGLELLSIAVGIVSSMTPTTSAIFKLGWRFSPTPWFAVLLLFVLARVFAHGTRMRGELEGTV